MRAWLKRSCKSGQNRFTLCLFERILALKLWAWISPGDRSHARTCRTITDWGHGHLPGAVGKSEEQKPFPCWLSCVPQNILLLLSVGFTSLLGTCLSKEQTPTGPSIGSPRPFSQGVIPRWAIPMAPMTGGEKEPAGRNRKLHCIYVKRLFIACWKHRLRWVPTADDTQPPWRGLHHLHEQVWMSKLSTSPAALRLVLSLIFHLLLCRRCHVFSFLTLSPNPFLCSFQRSIAAPCSCPSKSFCKFWTF